MTPDPREPVRIEIFPRRFARLAKIKLGIFYRGNVRGKNGKEKADPSRMEIKRFDRIVV